MFVIARTRRKRPSLMHKLDPDRARTTLCGIDLAGWSCAYFNEVIPQVECLRCKAHR